MSVNTKMTAIADEIRTLSGTTEAMGLDAMATNVGNANDAINDQNDILEQIKAALEGKAAGGSGEDVTAETNTYTDLLDDLETAIDALPDAGGSGGSIETCTVTFNIPSGTEVYYTAIENDEMVATSVYNNTYEPLSIAIVKGSVIVVIIGYTIMRVNYSDGISLNNWRSNVAYLGLKAQASENETITVVTD